MKIIIAIIPSDLVKNSLLFHFLPFHKNQEQKNQIFSKLVMW